MAEDIKKKTGGIGSGNMSTPATTSSNASGAGYGYAPLYESLAQMSNFSNSADMFAAANADASGGGTTATNTTNSPLKYTDEELAKMTVAEQQAAAASFDPTTLLGIDVEKSALGTGASILANALLPAGMGIPGLIASYIAKQQLQNSRDVNQNSIEGYLKGNNPSFGATLEDGITPVVEVAAKAYSGPKVAEDSAPVDNDPLGTWIAQNIYGNTGNGTSNSYSNPSNGSVGTNNTYSGSGAGNTAGPGSNYSSPSSSD